MNNAATQWQKWSEGTLLGPGLGEWCLWSMVIKGERNHFSGCLFKSGERLLLGWDGFGNFEPDDTVYFARVLPVNEVAFIEEPGEAKIWKRGR